jgi:hypothetical protein
MTAGDPSLGLVIGTLFLGLLASVFWPVTRHAITIAHEGGHAMFSSLTGGTITAVTLRTTGAGLTNFTYDHRMTFIVAALFGYIGPSVFGILGAVMLANRLQPHVVLWVSFGLLVAILLQIRNFFGAVSVIIAGFLFFMVARYGTTTGRTVFAYTWVWFLLMGGFWHVLEFIGIRQAIRSRGRKDTESDAFGLREKTHIPATLWVGFWWLASLVALVCGAGILLELVDVVPDGV